MDMEKFNKTFGVGKRLLVSTEDWFNAPDGQMYRAAFGEFKGFLDNQNNTKIKTGEKTDNWCIVIGNMIINNKQIISTIASETCDCTKSYEREEMIEGKLVLVKAPSRIYCAE